MNLEQLIINLKNESIYRVTLTEILERYHNLILTLWKSVYRTTIMSGKYFPGIQSPSGTWSRPGNPSMNDFTLQIGENTLIIIPTSIEAKVALSGNRSGASVLFPKTYPHLSRGKRSGHPIKHVRYVLTYDASARTDEMINMWVKDVLHFIIPAYTKLLVQRLFGG